MVSGISSPMNTVIIASAYRQLQPVEKRFVDLYLADLQKQADRDQVRLVVLLQQPVQMDPGAMLSRPVVLAAINERVAELSAQADLSVDKLVREWNAIAFSNIMDIITLDGYGNPQFDLSAATPEQQSALKKVEFEQSATGATRLKVEMHDKLRGLEVLSKYMGMVEPDNPHWRARNTTPILDSNSTQQDAADAYARTLEN